MTHHVQSQRTIPVSADTLWNTVAQMTGMEDWYPEFIATSEVSEPEAVQPKRLCTTTDGGELKERILLRDAKTRTFVYAIDDNPLPARNLVGTLRIDDLGDGRSAVTWSANMVLEDAQASQMQDMVTGIYGRGLESLERFHAG